MQKLGALGAMLCVMLGSVPGIAAEAPVPKIDKPKLETYIRYVEGYAPAVKFAIDDATPSPFPGYYRVLVHLSNGPSRLDRLYYVSTDGTEFVNGALLSLNQNPFVDTLDRLPTDGPAFGPANAKITMVVFSDFQCPYCREFAKTVRENVAQKYPNDVRVVFKNFPIDSLHPWATAAAQAGVCISQQKEQTFWAFHDWIFEHQGEVNPANLRQKVADFAKGQSLDPARLNACLDDPKTAAAVNESVQEGRVLQVQQTPTTFVNGRPVPGAVPWATLESVFKLELDRPKEIPAPAASKCCQADMPTLVKK